MGQASNQITHRGRRNNVEKEPLSDLVTHLLEECRMVLPGIQTLFGFQLIAIFNDTFWEKLASAEQVLHFAAIVLVAVSIALVMAPAAYHRQVEPETISRRFVVLTSNFLSWSMIPLVTALACEVYIIGELVFRSRAGSLAVTLCLLTAFIFFWFVLPRFPVLYNLLGSRRYGF